MTSWLRDISEITVVRHPNWPHPPPRGEHGLVEMPQALYERVDEYAHSTPTAPSAGRVYRRPHRMEQEAGPRP